jgi:hypothetical protein
MSDTYTGAAAPQRPTLLTVICILSFIAGAFSLWSGFQNAFTDAPQQAVEEAKAKMEEAMAQMGDQGMPMVQEMMESTITMAEKAAENAKPMGYGEIALALLSLFGVWNMWNLKKNGFWMYVAASVGGLVMPLVFLGGGLMTIIGLGFGGLISIVFIILYAVNLKHMH